jgi:[acyl-carrier-protein] S-malonyltransferase/trans-AT polyketide synthase/acyltransferase/oxidoreductase domain-containing protein
MASLAARSEAIWEIGPGRPLKAFFQTLGVSCTAVTTFAAAERAFTAAAASPDPIKQPGANQ